MPSKEWVVGLGHSFILDGHGVACAFQRTPPTPQVSSSSRGHSKRDRERERESSTQRECVEERERERSKERERKEKVGFNRMGQPGGVTAVRLMVNMWPSRCFTWWVNPTKACHNNEHVGQKLLPEGEDITRKWEKGPSNTRVKNHLHQGNGARHLQVVPSPSEQRVRDGFQFENEVSTVSIHHRVRLSMEHLRTTQDLMNTTNFMITRARNTS